MTVKNKQIIIFFVLLVAFSCVFNLGNKTVYADELSDNVKEQLENLDLTDLSDFFNENVNLGEIDFFSYINSLLNGEYSIDFKTPVARISSKKINDPFFDLFFGGDVMNMACYDCQARSTMAYTDIRLGDYWGPKYEMNKKGVSEVIVSSELGKDKFSSISEKMTIESAEFDNIIAAQSYGKVVKFSEQRRKYLLRALDEDSDVSKVAVKYRSMLPLKRRVKLFLKFMVKRLPDGISFRVRKILHSI